MTKTCQCGADFEVTDAAAKWVKLCPACGMRSQEINQAARAQAILDGRIKRWKEVCPEAFLRTRREKLPNSAVYDRVLAWNYSPTGLLLHGETGTGKSRCAWALLQREALAGRSVRALTAMGGADYLASFERGPGAAAAWARRLARADLVLFDDIFKVKMVDKDGVGTGFEGAFFSMLDERCNEGLPCIFTMNDTGASLKTRMSEDKFAPTLRRLREHCFAISCNNGKH